MSASVTGRYFLVMIEIVLLIPAAIMSKGFAPTHHPQATRAVLAAALPGLNENLEPGFQ